MADNSEVTLIAVGDIMLGDTPPSYGFGVGSLIEKFGPDYPFAHCAQAFKEADMVFGNLEVGLSKFDRVVDPFDRIVLRAQPETAEGLANAGINIVSLANNHIMQHGADAVRETIDVLSKYGIKMIGLKAADKNIDNCAIFENRGIKLGFLGYNLRPLQYFPDPPLYVEGERETIRNDIAGLKDIADIIVVSLHWGDEFIDYPSKEQIELGHFIIDSGANIILGHHPHILQGIERYKHGVIAYSLGNFIFDMWQKRFRNTVMLKLAIEKPAQIKYDIIPIVINSGFQPQYAEGKQAAEIRNLMEYLSAKIPHSSSINDYEHAVGKELRRYRREIYWHYLTHFHKYNFGRLISNFIGAVKRRLK